MKRYLLLWLMFLGLYAVRGQDGSLDETFNGTGWMTLHFSKAANLSTEETQVLLAQTIDGITKYIVLMQSEPGMSGPRINQVGGINQFLARYNPDGTLDETFGTDGFSQSLNLYANTAALQPDGSIIVGGNVGGETVEAVFALARYTTDGILDNTFGGDGLVTADFTPFISLNGVTALATQSDGSIVAVGNAFYPTIGEEYGITVARFASDGSPDLTFNSTGTVLIDFDYTDAMAYAVAIEADKDIVVAGRIFGTSYYSFLLARILGTGTSSGTLDASFDGDGIVITDFGANSYANAIVLQSGGTLIAAGAARSSTNQTDDLALACYNSDGTPYEGFNAGSTPSGTLTVDLGGYESIRTMTLDGENMVVAGTRSMMVGDVSTRDLIVARYTPAGVPDPTFNSGAPVITSIIEGVGDEKVNSVVVLSDNRIVVGGTVTNTTTENNDVLIVRYEAGGALDATFGTSGIQFGYYAWEAPAQISALTVQPDGKIIVAGVSEVSDLIKGAYNIMAVARYNPDGTLDPNFGNEGIALADFGGDVSVSSVVIQPDGKIVVGGRTQYFDETAGVAYYDFALARFTSRGMPDISFDGDGKVTTDFNGKTDEISALAIQPDGKIVAAGVSSGEGEGQYPDFFVVRYNIDGTLDRNFGPATADFFGFTDYVEDVAIQSDGKIVVSGSANNPDPLNPWEDKYDFALARFTSTGRLDRTFSGDGKATIDLGRSDYGNELEIQPDGKIVMGGQVVIYSESEPPVADFALVRFTSSGALDGEFNPAGTLPGVVITNFAANEEMAGPLVLLPDGKILLAGWYSEYSYETGEKTYFALARYTSAGELDASFDEDGKAAHEFGRIAYFRNAVAWYANRMYMAGSFRSFYGIQSGLLAAFEASSGTVTPTVPVVSINDVTVDKNNQTAAILTVSVTGGITTPFTITYATQDVTAVSKGRYPDYKAAKGSLTFTSTVTSAEITVPIIKTTTNTGYPKYFNVNLSLDRRTPDAATFSKSTGVVVITYTVSRQAAIVQAEIPTGRFAAIAYPNPAAEHFTLQLQSGNNAPVTLEVTDILGRVVEAKAGVAANATLQLGSNYRPGVYYVHLQQGSKKQTLKLVKGTQ